MSFVVNQDSDSPKRQGRLARPFFTPKINERPGLLRVTGRPGSPPPELLEIKVPPPQISGNGTRVPLRPTKVLSRRLCPDFWAGRGLFGQVALLALTGLMLWGAWFFKGQVYTCHIDRVLLVCGLPCGIEFSAPRLRSSGDRWCLPQASSCCSGVFQSCVYSGRPPRSPLVEHGVQRFRASFLRVYFGWLLSLANSPNREARP